MQGHRRGIHDHLHEQQPPRMPLVASRLGSIKFKTFAKRALPSKACYTRFVRSRCWNRRAEASGGVSRFIHIPKQAQEEEGA